MVFNKYILDIITIILYPTIIISSYCILIFINNYYFSTRLTYLLLLPTLSISCLGALSISIIKFYKEIHYLVIFNVENFFAINFMILFTYRGLLRYYLRSDDRNGLKKKIKKIKYILLLIYLSYLLYIIIINLHFYKVYFDIFHWNYYPLYVIVFVYFIGNIINIKLNSDINIKNDYISSFIVSFPGFILFISSKYTSLSENVYYIKYYWILLSGLFTYIFYSIVPLFIYFKNKYKNNNNGNNINKNSFNQIRLEPGILKMEEINFIKKYKELKESDIFDNNDNIYEIYFTDLIEKLKNIDDYREILDDTLNIKKIDELYNNIEQNILIKLYNYK